MSGKSLRIGARSSSNPILATPNGDVGADLLPRNQYMKLATRLSGALISFCALSASQPAGAADTTWTAAVNNDFYNAGNWDTNAFPTGADNVLILNPAVTASINFAGSPREIGSFHLGTDGATGG